MKPGISARSSCPIIHPMITRKIRVLPVAGIVLPLLMLGDTQPLLIITPNLRSHYPQCSLSTSQGSYPLRQEAFSLFHFISKAGLIIDLHPTDKAHALKFGSLEINMWREFVWTSVDKDNRTWTTGRLGFRTNHVKIVIKVRITGRVKCITDDEEASKLLCNKQATEQQSWNLTQDCGATSCY